MEGNQERAIMAGQAVGGSQLKPVSEEKHLRLDAAIEAQFSVISRLDSLIDRVRPMPTEVGGNCGTNTHQPSLADILEGGPDRIRDNTNRMLSQIDELESIIF